MLTDPGVLPLSQRNQHRLCRLDAAVQCGLRDADAQRRAVIVARQRHRARGGGDRQIRCGVAGLRTVRSKWRDRDIDQGRIQLRKVVGAETLRG